MARWWPAILACAALVPPAAAQPADLMATDTTDTAVLPATPLAPLDPASPWHGRFAQASDAVFAALASGDARQWRPVFGGRWLGNADAARIAALVADPASPWTRAAAAPAGVTRIFGWRAPADASSDQLAALAAGAGGEAIACRSAGGAAAVAWPATAAAAFAPHDPSQPAAACVRIVHSGADAAGAWRAFIDPPAP